MAGGGGVERGKGRGREKMETHFHGTDVRFFAGMNSHVISLICHRSKGFITIRISTFIGSFSRVGSHVNLTNVASGE
ncbi:hypothetical protein BG74_06510 [Sodalis-like endosymbiont of Proechinophthirus fluctus]|nr:hypothetical protein BG74_06510 [Sodalis-like endosymbiont of Proechinophthirus fluctus]